MPTERNSMHFRSVPSPLRRKVKSQAAAGGQTLAEWLEMAETVVGYFMSASERGMTMPEFSKMMLTYTPPKGKE